MAARHGALFEERHLDAGEEVHDCKLLVEAKSTKLTCVGQKIHEMTCGPKKFTGLTHLCDAIHQGVTCNYVTPQLCTNLLPMEQLIRVLVFRWTLLSQTKLSHDPLWHMMFNSPHAYHRASQIPKQHLIHALSVSSKQRSIAYPISRTIWLPFHLHHVTMMSV